MSENEENSNVRVEIQRILVKINEDMNKLKLELSSLNSFVEENGSLPITAQMVNEKLMIVAERIGIDLKNITELQEDSEENEESDDEDQSAGETEENGNSDQLDNETNTKNNAASVAAATKKLTAKVKSTLK